MRRWQVNRCVAVALLTAIALAGCGGGSSQSAKPKITPRETIRKSTQDVMRLQDALAKGGRISVNGGEAGPSGGYLGDIAKAKRKIEGEIGGYAVQQAIAMHEIQNGPIKSYDEFMDLIIKKGKPDALPLPTLPYYQEYAYDEENHKLVVVEFPEKVKQFESQK